MLRPLVLAMVVMMGCASAPSAPDAKVRAFAWQPWDVATFARARQESRPLLVHMAASWCHWCHVMEGETYTDAQVGALVHERFVPIRVDSDARPDLAERFADYAWPGTIVLTPDASAVLAAYRGYIPAARMTELLSQALTARSTTMVVDPEPTAPVQALPWVRRAAELALGRRWDDAHAGWGRPKRAANGHALAWQCARADERSRRRAERVIAAQAATLDRTWGGFYQYAERPDWTRPHIEKLVDQQGWMLEGLAACVAADVARVEALAQVELVLRWLDQMTTPEGLLMTAQDAKAQTPTFTPWRDTSTYARENGFVLAGLAALVEATRDPALTARGQRLADAVRMKWPELPRRDGVAYLEDAAALGHGLARWATVADDQSARAAAEQLWDDARAALGSAGAALFEASEDPRAVGLFAQRRVPFDGNVQLARFAAALDHGADARAILAAVATPGAIEDQGAWLGDFLLAVRGL